MDLNIELNNLMVKYKFKPEKKLGQNFIINNETINNTIKKARLKKTDVVLEIGAGTGFLTRQLLNKSKVIAIELDEKLYKLLRNELKEFIKNKKLILIQGDFRKKINGLKFNKIVCFPPYYLSKSLFDSIYLKKNLETAVMVMQQEFAEKLIAKPGFSNYKAISVLAQYFFHVSLKEIVTKEAFRPQPKSDSMIIMLKQRKRKKVLNEKKFIEFVKECFRQKNKNVIKVIKGMKKFKELKKEKITEFRKKNSKIMLLEVNDLIELFKLLFQES